MTTLKGKWIWWGISIGFCEEETEHGIFVSNVTKQPHSDTTMFASFFRRDSEIPAVSSEERLGCFIPWANCPEIKILLDDWKGKLKV